MGVSLGVNLLPYDGKLCSFDCIYCECGFNRDFRTKTQLPSRENVQAAISEKLQSLQKEDVKLDVITFAGNGEPTMHPDFSEIIDDTILLRNQLMPETKISVLTNGMNVAKDIVFSALQKIENPILKLDSAFDETVRLIDQPNSPDYSVARQVDIYKRFNSNFILQTMFLRGEFDGKIVNNLSEKEILAWLEIVKILRPREVMIYTIDRETPAKNLEKASVNELREIAERIGKLGLRVNVAG
jgi:wyosine [tRNA(Phe)-imidazoG37] synthetase (radical SAM superfamily)